jgi:L-amino acid N-acyltransferase YncA
MGFHTRAAAAADAGAIARIYNEGIEDRIATFETRPRDDADVLRWLEAGYPLVVASDEAGTLVAWASASPYRERRESYAGVADYSVYVARAARGRGAGRAALRALVDEAQARGIWKLVSRIFPENEASLALARSFGFREVGIYRRHARLDGEWRDVIIVELLLGAAQP